MELIMTTSKDNKSSKNTSKPIIKLLKEDHKKVKELFSEYEELKEKKNIDKKAELVLQICHELALHALAEEKIVYPVAREKIKDTDIMDEADEEHAGAKNLIKQLATMDPEDSHYDAKVTVLKEYIEHHVKEEETIMLPELENSDIDGEGLAEEVLKFKEQHSGDKIKSSKKNKDDKSSN